MGYNPRADFGRKITYAPQNELTSTHYSPFKDEALADEAFEAGHDLATELYLAAVLNKIVGQKDNSTYQHNETVLPEGNETADVPADDYNPGLGLVAILAAVGLTAVALRHRF